MLGERRSNSLFTPAASAEPERKPEQAEVHDISFEERTGRSLFAETATAPRASELFFAPQEKGVTFADALSQVQGYLSETYATLITEDNSGAKEQMKRRMARYLQENRIAVDGMTASELVDALYTEMAEYGFLTKYIFADGIEEIDINSWRDIEIQYSDGHTAKLEEHFDSPEHAANVIRRMLQNSGKVLDNASPIITSRLAKNIRISVIKTPVLDEDAGVAASIRIVNPRNLSKADFVQSGTATEEMLDFLSACLRYGVSICVAGATSSGKTTVAGWLLSTIPDRKRIFTIEDGSRELQLIRERDGRVTNSVVHTQTRDSENERQRIDQIALLDIALRFNPDIICVGEMRGPEANAAQEAARVGIAVLTTIHSNSSEGTYRRMVSLCKRAVDTPDDTLMGYAFDAEGKLIQGATDKNGIVKDDDGVLRYYVNGKVTYVGLIEIDGDFYYVRSNGEVVTDCVYWITWTHGLKEAGYYTFDENGKLTGIPKNGIVEEDGVLHYYVNGKLTYAGLIKIGDDYYYVNSKCEVVRDCDYYISWTHDLLPQGKYHFDADGKLTGSVAPLKNGIYEEDGSLYFYRNGERAYAGLIQIDGDYYYVRSTCEVVHDRSYYVYWTHGLMPEGYYNFDSAGRMILDSETE